MARLVNRLNNSSVRSLGEGEWLDGGGLYLVVGPGGSRSWIFRYRHDKARRRMGLGPFPTIGLAEARAKATEARKLLVEGVDPLQRKTKGGTTFEAFANRWLDQVELQWRNPKHLAQWRSTLNAYAGPILAKPVAAITTDDVLACLTPIWTSVPETASRVRARIEKVLSAAKAQGLRTGENPARWGDNLDHLLPARPALVRGHHEALPYRDVPEFVARLRARQGLSALALEWTILTAARSGETLGARWSEIEGDVWTVPAERMKSKRVHRVPLPPRCLEILAGQREFGGVYVFQQPTGKPLSNMAMPMLLRDMEQTCTVHGFRSTFRDWAGDCTEFPRELVEAALSHIIGDKAEQAYRRGDALERRRALMGEWGAYLG